MLSVQNQNKVRLEGVNDEALKSYSGWNRCLAEAAVEKGYTVELWPELEMLRISNGSQCEFFLNARSPLNTEAAINLASNKFTTNTLLSERQLPVPRGIMIDRKSHRDGEWHIEDLGFPLAVKPSAGTYGGEGVVLNIGTLEELEKQLKKSLAQYTRVIVEEYYKELREYRLLLLDDQLLAASERVPAYVVGDGKHTIDELIQQKNIARMERAHITKVGAVPIDDTTTVCLEKCGMNLHTVAPEGKKVILQEAVNASLGGEFYDVTEEIHQQNIDLAVEARNVLGLRLAGIDVVAEDLSQPLHKQRGAILEVNSAPGITCHVYPDKGDAQPVHYKIIDTLFNTH